MSDVKIHYDKNNNVRHITYCDNCKHGHLMKNSGAIYCDWWQYRVDEDGWCYKGEPK